MYYEEAQDSNELFPNYCRVGKAKQSNKRKGLNFSNHNPRTRQTIMKDLHHCMGNAMKANNFYQTIINWPQDNKTIQIYVCPFANALFSLLSDKTITKEVIISFSTYKNPFWWKHNPVMNGESVISELNHGKWWSKSWQDIDEQIHGTH